MSHSPFSNIELGPNFPAHDKGMANFELQVTKEMFNFSGGLFKQAWSGWPEGDTAPNANRSDSASQDVFDKLFGGIIKDIYA